MSGMNGPKILTLDIELFPNLAYVYGLFKQNINLAGLKESARVCCFAAKWLGERNVMFFSEYHQSTREMLDAAHQLLSEADIVVHYNGTSFDIPHLRRELFVAGYSPPAPFQEIDLLRVMRNRFKFTSNKLAYILPAVGLSGKGHMQMEDWIKCMLGDEKAWRKMMLYCMRDVRIEERLYLRVQPWIKNHPHVGLYSDEVGILPDACSHCGSTKLVREGHRYTQRGKYPRYHCGSCGAWGTGSKAEALVKIGSIG